MTIEGAITELRNLINADDVPFYYDGVIKKIIETIIDECKPNTDNTGVINEPNLKSKKLTETLSEQVGALEKDAMEYFLRLRYLEQAVLESDDYSKILKRANELYDKLEGETK